MNNNLIPIVAPELTLPDYGKGIAEQFDNIQRNFQNLISLPFLQGADGASYIQDIQTVTIASGGEYVLTPIGSLLMQALLVSENVEFMEAIAGCTTIKGIHEVLEKITSTYADVEDVQKYRPLYNGDQPLYLIDSLIDSKLFFYITKDDSGEVTSRYLAQPLHFIDARLDSLTDNLSIDWAFEDVSCFVGWNGSNFQALDLVPTIYYRAATGDWCWKIAGTKTGISAKGVQGADGKAGSNFWVVKVIKDQYPLPAVRYIDDVDSFLNTDTNVSTDHWIPTASYPRIGEVQTDDIAYAIIYYEGVFKDIAVGKLAKITTQGTANVKVIYQPTDMLQKWNYNLKDELFKIGTKEAILGDGIIRGLFLPIDTTQVGSTTTNVHMLYSDTSDKKLHLAPVEGKDVESNTNPNPLNDNFSLILHKYALEVDGNLKTGGQLDVSKNAFIGGFVATEGLEISQGTCTIDANGNINTGGSVSIQSTLAAKGEVTFNKGLQIGYYQSGSSNYYQTTIDNSGNFSTNGTGIFGRKLTANDGLTVNGPTNMNGRVHIDSSTSSSKSSADIDDGKITIHTPSFDLETAIEDMMSSMSGESGHILRYPGKQVNAVKDTLWENVSGTSYSGYYDLFKWIEGDYDPYPQTVFNLGSFKTPSGLKNVTVSSDKAITSFVTIKSTYLTNYKGYINVKCVLSTTSGGSNGILVFERNVSDPSQSYMSNGSTDTWYRTMDKLNNKSISGLSANTTYYVNLVISGSVWSNVGHHGWVHLLGCGYDDGNHKISSNYIRFTMNYTPSSANIWKMAICQDGILCGYNNDNYGKITFDCESGGTGMSIHAQKKSKGILSEMKAIV